MCTRSEVHSEIREAMSDLRRTIANDRDERIAEVAKRIHHEENDKNLRWIGIGGLLAIVSFIYFFGGLTNDVQHLEQQQLQVVSSLDEIEDFMNRGDRFTIDDGASLQQYSDQQDAILQAQIDRNHQEMKEWKDDIIDEIRSLNH